MMQMARIAVTRQKHGFSGFWAAALSLPLSVS
jgi:hypothetical protein